jgi:membrane protein YqaA with SNARE-associated domain
MIYIILAISVIIVNSLPAFAPPTWTLIVFFLNYYNLNIFAVVVISVIAATMGRLFLYSYIQTFSKFVFNKWEEKNLEYLGKKIGKNKKTSLLFIFLYSITPLSTTALFVASSIARVNIFILGLGFFLGRLVSYSFLAGTSLLIVNSLSEVIKNPLSFESIFLTILGFLILLIITFIDWKELLEKRKFVLNFKIWKWNK